VEENQKQEENEQDMSDESVNTESLKKTLAEVNDKYVRLYAEFENYKKFIARNKEEQLKYANESLMKDLLTVIDHLELALQHSLSKEVSNSLAEGVELTLKELKTVLEKYGLASIDALGKPFDPIIHHAMTQIESADADENTVVQELRKGYKYKDRVIRATLVGVAKKPSTPNNAVIDGSKDQTVATEDT
jgi:molecular chaperone GrpE